MDRTFAINCLETNNIDLLDVEPQNMCRTCTISSESLRNVHTSTNVLRNESGQTYLISEVIHELTSTRVATDDGLPQNICKSCIKSLFAAHQFLQQTRRVDRAFREYLRLSGSRTHEEEMEEAAEIVVPKREEVAVIVLEPVPEPEDKQRESSVEAITAAVDEDAEDEGDEKMFDILPMEPDEGEQPEAAQLNAPTRRRRSRGGRRRPTKPPPVDAIEDVPHVSKVQQSTTASSAPLATKGFQCHFCLKYYSFSQSLNRHMQSTHSNGAKSKSCSYCSREFSRADDLSRHIRTHTNERPYSCTTCKKGFKQASELKEHIRVHRKDVVYPCSICPKTLTTRQGLYAHHRTHMRSSLGASQAAIKTPIRPANFI